jgi:hypothetical protein
MALIADATDDGIRPAGGEALVVRPDSRPADHPSADRICLARHGDNEGKSDD